MTKIRESDDGVLFFWCPGCDSAHPVHVGEGQWIWNHSTTEPTFSPSLLVFRGREHPSCHSFVRHGMIEFLPDSQHALAGATVPIPDWPGTDWLP